MRKAAWFMAAGLAAMTAAPLRGQTSLPTTAPTTASAQPPATRPSVSIGDFQTLLADLASPDWRLRRQAGERLVRAGPEAKPFINELIARASNDEARKNALAALAAIDENRVLGTSYLTLHLKDANPATAFAEISRQCDAPLQTAPEDLWQQQSFPKVTLDVDHEPFWKVVPDLCQKLGVGLRPYQSGLRITEGGTPNQGVSQVDGPFLVSATQITYSRTRAFGSPREQSQFGITFNVFPEPKLRVLRGSGSIVVDEAVDDHGNSLLPHADARTRTWGGFGGYGGWNLYAPLEFPRKNPGTKLAKFRGTTRFVVQTESQKIDISEIRNVNQMTRMIHGMAVTFQDLKPNADAWQLRMHVSQPNLGGPDWQQLMDGVQNRMQVLDGEGTPLDHRGASTSSNNGAIDITLDFGRSSRPDGRQSGEPARLVWEVPTRTRELTVSISFKDLPLFDQN